MKLRQIGKKLEILSIILIVAGFIGICQPFTIVLYTYGFSVILAGVVLFNIAAHI